MGLPQLRQEVALPENSALPVQRRVSQECIYMLQGEAIEHSSTDQLFVTSADPRTVDYIEGRYR